MADKACVFVIGPESSGSKMVARIAADALGVAKYGDWDGTGWCDGPANIVCHRSLPYGDPPQFPDVDAWIAEYGPRYELYFILATRDLNISELSRGRRFHKPAGQLAAESARAHAIMESIIRSEHRWFIWSYESFMFLRKCYLDQLYAFLGVRSDFMPELRDGNRKRLDQLVRILSRRPKTRWQRWRARLRRLVAGR